MVLLHHINWGLSLGKERRAASNGSILVSKGMGELGGIERQHFGQQEDRGIGQHARESKNGRQKGIIQAAARGGRQRWSQFGSQKGIHVGIGDSEWREGRED